MKSLARSLLATLAALSLASCANPSHLIVYQHSNLGINGGVSPATSNFYVRIGLRREFAAVVPKYKEEVPPFDVPEPKYENDAASAYVAARMRVTGVFSTPQISEILATGQAAINAANGNRVPAFITDN